MRAQLAVLAVVTGALLSATATLAHHGAAAYTNEIITLQGTITDFRFINPHVQVYFEVTNENGDVEQWQGELTAPNKLARAGWTKNTLQPGDRCRISGRAGRNAGRSLWIRELITADGESLPLFESID